jgi:hypothetical protein
LPTVKKIVAIFTKVQKFKRGMCVLAAFTVDRRWMGRLRMQIMGFFFVFIIFLMCAIFYGELIKPGANIQWFQVNSAAQPCI